MPRRKKKPEPKPIDLRTATGREIRGRKVREDHRPYFYEEAQRIVVYTKEYFEAAYNKDTELAGEIFHKKMWPCWVKMKREMRHARELRQWADDLWLMRRKAAAAERKLQRLAIKNQAKVEE